MCLKHRVILDFNLGRHTVITRTKEIQIPLQLQQKELNNAIKHHHEYVYNSQSCSWILAQSVTKVNHIF